MYGVFIIDMDRLKDPDWQTLPLSALMSMRLWYAGLAGLLIEPEDREKAIEAIRQIQEERDPGWKERQIIRR
jgi:hypothetical protein